MQQFYKFITWNFVLLNMFRALPRPSSGAYNCINSHWFYQQRCAVGQTTTNNAATTTLQGKTRGC
jgi:hypothetical protein